MILDELKNWKGAVEINGVKFDKIKDASNFDFKTVNNQVCIILYSKTEHAEKRKITQSESDSTEYVVTVKQYMTRKATPDFDFMAKWNNDNLMPLRTMVGTVEKQTRGMVYMKLHGDIVGKTVQRCMKCGKIITNPVSQYFGMGPECGGHHYSNPFESEEELREAVANYRKNYLQHITWEGWIIKSAITETRRFENEDNTGNE